MIRKLIHFSDTHEAAACLEDWRACLEHAEAIGLGTQAYTLHTL